MFRWWRLDADGNTGHITGQHMNLAVLAINHSIGQLVNAEFKVVVHRVLVDDVHGVHILDPFTGTGNFIVRVMQEIKKTALAHKYKHELHCNEVMLLPYYVASMNIEHEFYELTGRYEPFEGICLVDTFELMESRQAQLSFMTPENTARVERQKRSPITVIIGNPPYQLRSAGGTRDIPIYNKFVDQAKKLNPRFLCMIIPSRWMASGLGLSEFRRTMLNDRRIRKFQEREFLRVPRYTGALGTCDRPEASPIPTLESRLP